MDILDKIAPFFTHLTDEDRARGIEFGLSGDLPPLRGKATPEHLASLEEKRLRHVQQFFGNTVLGPPRHNRLTDHQCRIIGNAMMGEDRVIWWQSVSSDFYYASWLGYGKRAAYKRLNPDLAIELNLQDTFGSFSGKDANHAETMFLMGHENLL